MSLLDILDKVHGEKTLVIDQALMTFVSALVPYSTLKAHGAQNIVPLSDDLQPLKGSVVYLASSDPVVVQKVISHVQESTGTSYEQRILAIRPTVSPAFASMVLKAGLAQELKLVDWPDYFIDCGPVRSLGFGAHVSTDELCWRAAQALHALQKDQGPFGRVTGHGDAAKRVSDLLEQQWKEQSALAVEKGGFDYHFGQAFVGTNIDHLLLIDRYVDPVMPLISQLTYHGLMDEAYGVSSAQVVNAEGTKAKLEGEVFTLVRDLNFGEVGGHLNTAARQLQSDYDARHEAKSVDEIKQFVSKLGGLQAAQNQLKIHTAIAELLMAHVRTAEFELFLTLQQALLANDLSTPDAIVKVQELIYRGSSLGVVLRSLCLVCICRGGVKEKLLQSVYEDILHTYGFSKLEVIHELEAAELLYANRPTNPPATFTQIARAFVLNSEEPLGDIFAGYVPLTARLTQAAAGRGPGDPALLGQYFDIINRSDLAKEAKLRRILLRNTPGHEKPTVLVMVIGGVTYAEAAAIRAASTDKNIVVVSTGIITGNEFVYAAK